MSIFKGLRSAPSRRQSELARTRSATGNEKAGTVADNATAIDANPLHRHQIRPITGR
jgi:hypothetical protein